MSTIKHASQKIKTFKIITFNSYDLICVNRYKKYKQDIIIED